MINETLVELSRWQFAATAMYHFLFVPLTLGLSFMLAIMESVYVITGKQVYKDMVKYWGKLFGINFALGVTTGLTMEFQFGTNWAYYSHYVGDIFGAPLAIEGLMAFFLESTFIGLFFFGWDRLSKVQHLSVTWLVAFGSNLSALWILIANGWMQNPVGSEFNFATMRMEMTSFAELIFNPVAQVKFVHTVSAGYTTGYFLLRQKNIGFAKRSFAIAAAFGLASICSTILLGDESGYEIGDIQKTKLAVMESEWETHPPPANFNLIAIPNEETQRNEFAIEIPYALGIIATRSLDTPVTGIKDLQAQHAERIRKGMQAYGLLQKLKNGEDTPQNRRAFAATKKDLGYGLLLKKYTENITDASEQQILQAADDSIPKVAPLFWSFRLMVFCGFCMLLLFIIAFYESTRHRIGQKRWVLHFALWSLPLPWLSVELGWFVAEYGRQPWTIGEVLPTQLSASSLTPLDLMGSMSGFIVLYTIFLVVEVYLMQKFIRKGPGVLGTGRYHDDTRTALTSITH